MKFRAVRSMKTSWVVLLALGLVVLTGCAQSGPEPFREPSSSRAAAASLPRASAESVGLSSEALDRLDLVLDGYVDRGQIPGYQLLVARRGKVVHETVRGSLEVESNRPLEEDSIYRIYSMSKVVTGVATMIAYERGSFLLTDPVSDYLPSFSDMTVLTMGEGGEYEVVPATREMTIIDLLRHTSGLAYTFTAPPALRDQYLAKGITPGLRGGPAEGGPLGPAGTDTEATLADLAERLGEVPLVAEPGSVWHYGVSMDVLGRLIEVVSGQTYPEFLKQSIFEPLGMTDTAFFVSDDQVDRFAASYVPTEDKAAMTLLDAPATSNYRTPPAMPSGGGGLVSTAHDYMRFALMLANEGELDGVRLLSPRTVEFMMSNHLPEDIYGNKPLARLYERDFANGGRGVGFGLTGSVIVDPVSTGFAVSKGAFGWGGAASTFFWVDPEQEISVVFMTQLLPSGTHPLRGHLMKGVNAAILTY
jgi:CubicO group peptidase (beta-lactamase class C family)